MIANVVPFPRPETPAERAARLWSDAMDAAERYARQQTAANAIACDAAWLAYAAALEAYTGALREFNRPRHGGAIVTRLSPGGGR